MVARPGLAALLVALALPAPVAAPAQTGALPPSAGAPQAPAPATLIADRIDSTKNTLIAEGHVVVLYKGSRLQAQKVTYDRTAGTIQIEGPLVLIDAAGQTKVLANGGELSADLQNGILHSAQMVLQDRIEIASNEFRRVDGRYSRLTTSVTSACKVCAEGQVPLWEIRARHVEHDDVDHRIRFRQAQLRFWGVPVFYLPAFSLPDNTVKRQRGFLTPKLSDSTLFGLGLRMPYFIPFGPSSDLTLLPVISAKNARSLGLRYRQAYDNGALEFRGAVSRDTLRPGKIRGYLFGTGYVDLSDGFKLKFQLQTVSDPDYFLNYGLTQVDRLESGLELIRTRRNEYIDGRLLHFHSIRYGEDNATLPSDVVTGDWVRRFVMPQVGGQASLAFRGLALTRSSEANGVGRDMSRAGLAFNWRRDWMLPEGIVATAIGSVTSDFYSIQQDSSYPGTVVRSVPQAALQLAWPWVRSGAGGVSQVIEPVVQLIESPKTVPVVPNEDSQVSDFDEGNLFSLSHFNGVDGVELGRRVNVGVTWHRYDPTGWTLGVAAGRIWRQEAANGYDPASGLSGTSSGWLIAGQAKRGRLAVINRAVFGNGHGLTKNEMRLSWGIGGTSINTSYIYTVANPASYPSFTTKPTKEWVVDTSFPIYSGWRGVTSWRYNFTSGRADYSSLLLQWRNECMSVDLSLARSYASSTSTSPTMTFGFAVGLVGFGGGSVGSAPVGSCRR